MDSYERLTAHTWKWDRTEELKTYNQTSDHVPDNFFGPRGIVVADVEAGPLAVSPENALIDRIKGETAWDTQLRPRQLLYSG
jgi:hypothetical protein